MPEIDINGEMKKVACGPCIRGHRSSKCQHHDRVLIEVRKPGRPLSACPHPAGSCGCERAVVYAIPRDAQNLMPMLIQSGGSVPPRVQRPKGRRNGSSVTPANLQMSLDRLDSAALMNPIRNQTQNDSGSSSNVPSLVTSSNSTPQINAIDGGPIERNDSSRPSFEMKDEQRHGLQYVGMVNSGGYASWAEDKNSSDYRGTQPTSSEPARMQPPSDCCGSKPPGRDEMAGQTHQDALQTGFGFGQSPQPIASQGRQPNFGHEMNGPSPHANTVYGPFRSALEPFPFSEYENRRGCSTNGQPSSHIHGSECPCGDGCNCFACSTHPRTHATQKYVMAAFFSQYAQEAHHTQQHAGLPSQPQLSQPIYSGNSYIGSMPTNTAPAPNLQQNPFPTFQDWTGSTRPYDISQEMLQPTMTATAGASAPYNFQYSMSPTSNNRVLHASQRPVYEDRLDSPKPLNNFHSATDGAPQSTSIIDTDPAVNHESPSTDQDDNVSTLSSSRFQIQQLSMPGCGNDITGTCTCGDACTCLDCMFHSEKADELFGGMNEISAGGSDGNSYRSNDLDHLQLPDTNGFNLEGLNSGYQPSMTPASPADDFENHMI